MLAAISPSERPDAAPAPMQRAEGLVDAAFVSRGGRTYLANLRESGSAKMRLPRQYAASAEAVLINTAGGLAGGDRLAVSVALGEGARAVVTTQAHERVYKSSGDAAAIETTLSVGRKARLDWLPQETILFDRARLRRSYRVEIDPDATFLGIEAIIFGRHAMGETVATGSLHDRWRVTRGGRLIFADDLRMEGDIGALAARHAALGGNTAIATILLVGTDADRHVERLRAAIGEAGGVSAFDGRLVARIAVADGYRLRQILCAAIAALADSAALPRVWQQ